MKLPHKFCFIFLFFFSLINADPRVDLLESASKGYLDGVKKALSEKVDINFKDSIGTSALMFAANNNHFQIVKYLVDNRADILAKNTYGWTAAIMAGARGNTFIKEFLDAAEQKIIKSRATGIVLAVIGEAYVENRKLSVGDRVLENQTIYVAKKSVCELQIKQSLSEFSIRLKGDTLFALNFKEDPNENIFSGFVKMGSAIFKIEKIFSGEKIQAITPTVVASVRGTIFEVTVDKEGSTKIFVVEGAVRTRVRVPDIEEDEVIENTPEIKKLISNLEYNSKIIPTGHSLEMTPKIQKEILKKADADGLKKRAMRQEFSSAPIPGLSLKCSEKPAIKEIKAADVDAKLKESEDLIGIEAAKLKNSSETSEALSLIETRKEKKMIANFQPEVLKKPESILLNNGITITGSIYQIGKKYVVFSSVGKQVFNEEEVKGFVFE